MKNVKIDGVSLNAAHLSKMSEEDFVKEFSTADMKETGPFAGVKGIEKLLKDAYTEIKGKPKASPETSEKAPENDAKQQEDKQEESPKQDAKPKANVPFDPRKGKLGSQSPKE